MPRAGQPATSPTIAAWSGALLSCNGTNLRAEGGGSGAQPYDFGFVKAETPTSSEVIGKVVIPRDMTLPADLAGAAYHVDTNPTAQVDIDLTDDGTSIGTITIATDGSITFVTAGNTAKSVAAGSVVRFVAPREPRCDGGGHCLDPDRVTRLMLLFTSLFTAGAFGAPPGGGAGSIALVNGDFETGDFSGWTIVTGSGWTAATAATTSNSTPARVPTTRVTAVWPPASPYASNSTCLRADSPRRRSTRAR